MTAGTALMISLKLLLSHPNLYTYVKATGFAPALSTTRLFALISLRILCYNRLRNNDSGALSAAAAGSVRAFIDAISVNGVAVRVLTTGSLNIISTTLLYIYSAICIRGFEISTVSFINYFNSAILA